jgi:hypothetical protein
MKKFVFLTSLLGLFIVLNMSSGVGQNDGLPNTLGIRMDMVGACNDNFFVANMIDPKIYEIHGYEYGCGTSDRLSWGTVNLAGGVAYFAWKTISTEWDYGNIGIFTVPISLQTKAGTGTYMFIYSDSGVLSQHGNASVPYSVSLGPNPNALAPSAEPDVSIK